MVLRVAIVGGGIGGLTLARTLLRRNAAASVRVYEQNEAVLARGGGIFLTQGAAVLDRLGLTDEFLAVANGKRRYQLVSEGKTLIDVAGGSHPFLYQVLRQNLQQLLVDSVGDVMRLGARVESIEEGPSGATLTFADGATEEVDLVVGADGISSTVARRGFDSVGDPVWTGYQMLYATTDEHVRDDPALLTSCYGAAVDPVAGEDRPFYKFSFTIGGPDGDVRRDAVSITREVRAPVSNAWDATVLIQEMQGIVENAYPDNHDNCHDIIAAAASDRVFGWGIYECPRRPTWISTAKRTVLLGDAAHAMSPFMGVGGNNAMQDGYCLGNLLSDAAERAGEEDLDLNGALSEYERIRKGPCDKAMKNSRNVARTHFLRGWKASARNTALRAANLAIPIFFKDIPWDKHRKLQV